MLEIKDCKYSLQGLWKLFPIRRENSTNQNLSFILLNILRPCRGLNV